MPEYSFLQLFIQSNSLDSLGDALLRTPNPAAISGYSFAKWDISLHRTLFFFFLNTFHCTYTEQTCKLQTVFNRVYAPSVVCPSGHGRCSRVRTMPGSWLEVATIGFVWTRNTGILQVYILVFSFLGDTTDVSRLADA